MGRRVLVGDDVVLEESIISIHSEPIEAKVATLMHVNWDPFQPNLGIDNRRCEMATFGSSTFAATHILHAL